MVVDICGTNFRESALVDLPRIPSRLYRNICVLRREDRWFQTYQLPGTRNFTMGVVANYGAFVDAHLSFPTVTVALASV
jgi:hypothetical protein